MKLSHLLVGWEKADWLGSVLRPRKGSSVLRLRLEDRHLGHQLQPCLQMPQHSKLLPHLQAHPFVLVCPFLNLLMT